MMSDMASPFYGNILITGVTGLIGRHLLYEYIHYFLQHQWQGNLYVLMRSKKSASASERLEHILRHEFAPNYFKVYPYDRVRQKIKIIEGSIEDKDLIGKMKSVIPFNEKVYVIHCAGSVNLLNTEQAEKEVQHNNVMGTQNLLHAALDFNSKFIFISTAFSCGIVNGTIGNDYSQFNKNTFRNPYEQSKLAIERMVEQECLKKEREYQILRPSAVCGRMIDPPLYYTSKIDVMYGWTKFFWNMKKQEASDHIRIHMAEHTVLNVVPVDFVAKSIVRLFSQNIPYVNLTYPKSLSNRGLYGQMLQSIGFSNYSFVDVLPDHLNKGERLYYRLIDKVYSPYLNNCTIEYDTNELNKRINSHDIPEIDLHHLTEFAMEFDFDDSLIY
ncbi:Male sterility domain protein [Paenibacillus curdlanolyticus YK9]|uniref:Male sterility domain protein n=1 Tax=Paenibacillus curdlanolyticus YK9 TaxID=717606 RepID=E0I5X7_9BACL|nr:SDR family oxidoreductase [Paenibacillus curdlanolyticus]EFM12369.1 Male sterility domain protein [Paenibacillus curdlanolyticus YK9]